MNDNGATVESAEEHQRRVQREFDAQEERNARRRMLHCLANDAMEEDRMWFKWQLAVWAEQIK